MYFNSLRPRLNRRPFADDIFKCIFLNENEWISPRISLKLVPKVQINNIPALVQIMAWRRSGDKPLSEQMMVSLLTHICVTRPQWVNEHIQFNELLCNQCASLYNPCFREWYVTCPVSNHYLNKCCIQVKCISEKSHVNFKISTQRHALTIVIFIMS